MQTFLPYSDFTHSAEVLDNKRLGKQRVESLQILNVLLCGPYQKKITATNSWVSCDSEEYNEYKAKKLSRKTPWYNHPAAQMWKGYEIGLQLYTYVICNTWITRGFVDTVKEKIFSFPKLIKLNDAHDLIKSPSLKEVLPPWIGNLHFHDAHKSNLLRKLPEHYIKFDWNVPADLPYVWPSKL